MALSVIEVLELIIFIPLKKTFHRERHFSPNHTIVLQFFDFILNFIMCQVLLGYPIFRFACFFKWLEHSLRKDFSCPNPDLNMNVFVSRIEILNMAFGVKNINMIPSSKQPIFFFFFSCANVQKKCIFGCSLRAREQ